MAKMLNAALPPGSRGLWWFRESLKNLGTAPTGDAVLVGSQRFDDPGILHDAQTDRTQLSPTAALVIPSNAITLMMGYRTLDTVFRVTGELGLGGSDANQGQRAGLHMFLTYDGLCHFDFGGGNNGSTRVQASVGKDLATHVWAFTTGPRGMEMWRDGVKIASHGGQPTSQAATSGDSYNLGTHAGTTSDFAVYEWMFIHETQLAATLIQAISANPAGQLTQEAPPSGPPVSMPLGRGRLLRAKLVSGWTPVARVAPEGAVGAEGPQGPRGTSLGFPIAPRAPISTATWTWYNEGNATVRDHAPTGSTFVHAVYAGNEQLRVKYRPLGAGVTRITAGFMPIAIQRTRWGWLGLVMGEAATDRWLGNNFFTDDGIAKFEWRKNQGPSNMTAGGTICPSFPQNPVFYLRVEFTPTQYSLSYSWDGLFFTVGLTENKNTFFSVGPDRVGLGGAAVAAAYSGLGVRCFHWEEL